MLPAKISDKGRDKERHKGVKTLLAYKINNFFPNIVGKSKATASGSKPEAIAQC